MWCVTLHTVCSKTCRSGNVVRHGTHNLSSDISRNLTSRKKQQTACSLLKFRWNLQIKCYTWLFLLCIKISSLNSSLIMDNGTYRDTNCGSGMLHGGTMVSNTVTKELISDSSSSRWTSSHIYRCITHLQIFLHFFPNPSNKMFRSWLKMSHDHIHVINHHANVFCSIISVPGKVVNSTTNTNIDYSSQPHARKVSTNTKTARLA